MGVLFHIYCIPSEPNRVDWDAMLHRLLDAKVVKPPFGVAPALESSAGHTFLRSPRYLSECSPHVTIDEALRAASK